MSDGEKLLADELRAFVNDLQIILLELESDEEIIQAKIIHWRLPCGFQIALKSRYLKPRDFPKGLMINVNVFTREEDN